MQRYTIILTYKKKFPHCFRQMGEKMSFLHFFPSKDRTILAVGVGTTDVGSIGGTRAGIKTYHTPGVERHKHTLGAEHVLPEDETAICFFFKETDVGRETLANNGEETSAVHCLEHHATFATIVNTELTGTTVILPRTLAAHVEQALLVGKGIGTVIEIAQADYLAYGQIG